MTKLFVFIMCLLGATLFAQSNVDSLLAALPTSKDTLRLQALDQILTQVRGTDKDLAQRLINEEYELAAIIKSEKFTAAVHNSNAIFKYFQSDLDSAIFYFEQSLSSFQKIGARDREAFLNNNIGILYETKGDFETSIEYHLASLKIKEELGDQKGIATSKFNIGNLWTELGNYERAKVLYDEAHIVFEELELPNQVNDVIFSLANIASNQDSAYKALSYYYQTLTHYERIDDQYGTMEALGNIGQEYYTLNKLDSALYFYNRALPMAIKFEDLEQQASLSRHMGDVYSRQGKHTLSIPLLEQSVEVFKSINYKDQLTDSYQFLYEGQERAGMYEEAYNNMHRYVLLRDSIASIKMQTDLIELETKYETEKKEKELVISRAVNDKKQARIRLLISGLGALLLLLITGYYAMRQKIKRNKVEKEKVVLELNKAEQQLEFKKKELTAKVLQLAKKNEFLQELEGEVAELQSSVDASVGKTSSRISRMIQRDSSDDEDWEQFGKEFSSVHQDFLDRLRERYGTFSKSEMRLIALLRMNMTSKDIANTLRISSEGVRKARYRLRQKLNIDQSVDLAGLIMGM